MKVLPLKTGSKGNMYILTTSNNYKYLIECGISKKDIIKILFEYNYKINEFEGCFVSHKHLDHCESIEYVSKYMPVYSNEDVRNSRKGNIICIPPNKVYRTKDLKIIPFHLEHGNVENYGYIFKDDMHTILFATDFSTIKSNIFNIVFDEIYIECNWNKELILDYQTESKENRQINTHCSLDITYTALRKLNLSLCKKITLIHPSQDYCDIEKSLQFLREKIPNIEIVFAENLI